MRVRFAGLVAALGCVVLGVWQLVGGTASAASGAATQRVIVVFRNQDVGQPANARFLPARSAAFRAARAAV